MWITLREEVGEANVLKLEKVVLLLLIAEVSVEVLLNELEKEKLCESESREGER